MRRTPDSYRRYPNGVALPDEMKVWAVENRQDTRKRPGAVSRSLGYNDSPDAEALLAGYNEGKQYGSVAVGRHANFLQWGYAGQPSEMTDAGCKLFLNCIVYISKFDGKAPLIRVKAKDRNNAVVLSMARSYLGNHDIFKEFFPAWVLSKYGDDWKGMMKFYQDNLELAYQDRGKFIIDMDLPKLGIESNRKVETLGKLIELFDDPEGGVTARKLLSRYTTEYFKEKRQWQSWFEERKERIYFTDVGGYEFLVVPEGYLEPK